MAGVAIFDLDGTLTRRGCFLPFVLYVLERRAGRIVAVPQMLAAGAALVLRLTSADNVKRLIWRQALSGLQRPQATALGEGFARHWAATALRPGARAVVERHRAAGDRLVLATAAMDLIAEPFAAALGLDAVVATRTGWTAAGQVGPRFDGANCKGAEKLRRVRRALGDDVDPARVVAYSDHADDLPLLRWAGCGVAVNSARAFAGRAAGLGLETADWNVASPAGGG